MPQGRNARAWLRRTLRPQPCAGGAGCGEHGVCNLAEGVCRCQAGWEGEQCEQLQHPACLFERSSGQPLPQVRIPCAGLRKLSPVACECLAQCIDHGEEVCGSGSAGCNNNWKEMRKDPSTQSYAWNMSTRATFFAALTCLAHPPGKTPSSSLPANSAVVLTTFADFRSHGYQPNGARVDPTRVPAFGANVSTMPEETRGGGFEPMYPSGAVWAPSAECSDSPVLFSQRRNGGSVHRGCNGRGRCMLQPGATAGTCICVDGAYGAHCEHVCQNDCFHDCSGHGECVHGFCRCDDGFFGVDCSDMFEAHVGRRSSMHFDRRQFGAGPVGVGGRTRLRQLPRQIQKHIERLYHSVYVYDLPAAVNRDGAK